MQSSESSRECSLVAAGCEVSASIGKWPFDRIHCGQNMPTSIMNSCGILTWARFSGSDHAGALSATRQHRQISSNIRTSFAMSPGRCSQFCCAITATTCGPLSQLGQQSKPIRSYVSSCTSLVGGGARPRALAQQTTCVSWVSSTASTRIGQLFGSARQRLTSYCSQYATTETQRDSHLQIHRPCTAHAIGPAQPYGAAVALQFLALCEPGKRRTSLV